MKTIIYKIDERKLLHKNMWLSNNEHSSEYINKVIDQCFSMDNFSSFTFKLSFKDGLMFQEFTNNKTNEIFHNSNNLPVLVRNLYHKLFDKLYWKYCN